MLALDSPKWATLTHAFGSASDIPQYLRDLESFPEKLDHNSEPYESLWSSLWHQGTIYTASFAAVPHLVDISARNPAIATYDGLDIAIMTEVRRLEGGWGPELPDDLAGPYREAIDRLPQVALDALKVQGDKNLTLTAAAAVAMWSGRFTLAELMYEFEDDDVCRRTFDWVRFGEGPVPLE
ncbi:MAG: hypothetical protein AAGD34_03025 [Pseudomonadota bacterium]